MLAQTIIERYNLQSADSSSLSDQEALMILNRVLNKIYIMRPWGFLERTHTGAVSNQAMDLPTDYQYIIETFDGAFDYPIPCLYYSQDKIFVIPKEEHRNYTNNQEYPNIPYAYVDLYENKIKLLSTSYNGKNVSFDYIYQPEDILITGTPKLPERFQNMLPHLMVVEFDIIDQGEKGLSYSYENNAQAMQFLDPLIYWDTKHKTYGSGL